MESHRAGRRLIRNDERTLRCCRTPPAAMQPSTPREAERVPATSPANDGRHGPRCERATSRCRWGRRAGPLLRWRPGRNEAEYLDGVLRPIRRNTRGIGWSKVAIRIASHSPAGWVGDPLNNDLGRHCIAPAVDLNFIMALTNCESDKSTITHCAAGLFGRWLAQSSEPRLQLRVRHDAYRWSRE
jgi:hypothetical protein